MVVDASALVAILLDEPDARSLAERLDKAERHITHPISVYEAVTAVARETKRGVAGATDDVMSFLADAEIHVVPIGIEQARAAVAAFAQYGKGQGHPAKLNMGDCFSYACAKSHGLRLLYKGADFAATDLA